jgi:hypothetical protein
LVVSCLSFSFFLFLVGMHFSNLNGV